MSSPTQTTPGLRQIQQNGRQMLEPFLTLREGGWENHITEKTLPRDHPHFPLLSAVESGQSPLPEPGAPLSEQWLAEGWLIHRAEDWDRRFHLRFVSLEAHSLCNQACVFCPVSAAPRPEQTMTLDFYRGIVSQLSAFRHTIRGVFMNNYNEPTADRNFVEQVRILRGHGLQPALNTNASGLTPARVDALMELGGLAHLSVNLSTLDPERYRRDRGSNLLPRVLKNLEYLARIPLAPRMVLAVLGHRDTDHEKEREAIAGHFRDSLFEVEAFTIMDRAQWLDLGLALPGPLSRLRGCDQTGSRPLQHLHINASGECVLCCQDYNETHVVGDLRAQSVPEVLRGDALARQRRIIYGYEAIPDRHICSRCIFACT